MGSVTACAIDKALQLSKKRGADEKTCQGVHTHRSPAVNDSKARKASSDGKGIRLSTPLLGSTITEGGLSYYMMGTLNGFN